MKTINSIRIRTKGGLTLEVPLENCGDREAATIFIDNVPYHIERMPKSLLCEEYKVDTEPGYDPQTDDANHCVMVAPFSQK
jgi:hypothetical protein